MMKRSIWFYQSCAQMLQGTASFTFKTELCPRTSVAQQRIKYSAAEKASLDMACRHVSNWSLSFVLNRISETDNQTCIKSKSVIDKLTKHIQHISSYRRRPQKQAKHQIPSVNAGLVASLMLLANLNARPGQLKITDLLCMCNIFQGIKDQWTSMKRTTVSERRKLLALLVLCWDSLQTV